MAEIGGYVCQWFFFFFLFSFSFFFLAFIFFGGLFTCLCWAREYVIMVSCNALNNYL